MGSERADMPAGCCARGTPGALRWTWSGPGEATLAGGVPVVAALPTTTSPVPGATPSSSQ
jgi:hypothetical protein